MKKPLVKTLNFSSLNAFGEPIAIPIPEDHEKTASVTTEEVNNWLAQNARPKNVERILITGLGAYEGFGPNVNGDGFHERDLLAVPKNVHLGSKPYDKPMYSTFVDFSRLYKGHRNKPHDHAYGVIPFASYNPRMRRVELITDIFTDDKDNQPVLDDMDRGVYPSVSMGFRCVPGDVCSVCENYDRPFPSRAHYCTHLRYHMLEIDSGTGRIIYAINHNGYFFDMSIVIKGADRIAQGMRKISSPVSGLDAKIIGIPEFGEYSSKVAEDAGVAKEIEDIESLSDEALNNPPADNVGDLNDGLPEHMAQVLRDDSDPGFRILGLPMVYRTDVPIDRNILNHLAVKYAMPDLVATLASFAVMPRAEEFQRLFLVSHGYDKQADYMDEQNIVFDPDMNVEIDDEYDVFKHGAFSPVIADDLFQSGVLDSRSYMTSFMAKRAADIKLAFSAEEFFAKYPIIKSPTPVRKMPADYQEQAIAAGINRSNIGQPGKPVVYGGGRYVGPKPEGATVVHNANPLIPLAILAALYGGANWIAGVHEKGPLSKAMRENPRAAAGAFGVTAALAWLGQRVGVPVKDSGKQASVATELARDRMVHILGGIATSYALAGRASKKREEGVQPNLVEEAFEKRPALGAILTAIGYGLVGKQIKTATVQEIEKFEETMAFDGTMVSVFEPEEADRLTRLSLVNSSMRLNHHAK